MEKKDQKFDEIKVDQPKIDVKKSEKLAYEDLELLCNQLDQQNKLLIKRIGELDQISFFKRMDYLFEVVKNESVFSYYEKTDFVQSCVNEIENALTIPEDKKEETE